MSRATMAGNKMTADGEREREKRSFKNDVTQLGGGGTHFC